MKIKIRDTATAAELGRWLGLTGKEIAAHASVVVRAKQRGSYVLKKSIQSFCGHVRKAASGRESPAVIERRRLIKAQADLAVTKAQALSDTLLDAGEVEAEWSSILRGVRAQTMAVPSRVAARIAHLSRGDISDIDDVVRAKLTAAGSGDDASATTTSKIQQEGTK